MESKLKKGTIPENVVLGDKRDMTPDDGTVLENVADTTAKQLADGWLTWAETQQQSTLPQPELLGHRIAQEGRTPISKGVEAIVSMPTPKNTSAVKRFLGLFGYFRDFIPDMSYRTQALRCLLKKGVAFQWKEQAQKKFDNLKQAIISPNVMLHHPDWDSPFELHVDVSKHTYGAMLAQGKDGILRPVRIASRSHQQNPVGPQCIGNFLL